MRILSLIQGNNKDIISISCRINLFVVFEKRGTYTTMEPNHGHRDVTHNARTRTHSLAACSWLAACSLVKVPQLPSRWLALANPEHTRASGDYARPLARTLVIRCG